MKTKRKMLQRPDYRNNGKFQFVVGYTGGGAEMCVHLSAEEISKRAAEKLGPGNLIITGKNLWWQQPHK